MAHLGNHAFLRGWPSVGTCNSPFFWATFLPRLAIGNNNLQKKDYSKYYSNHGAR